MYNPADWQPTADKTGSHTSADTSKVNGMAAADVTAGVETANNTEQHFWTDTDGLHIASTGDHDTSGFHQLLTSVKNAFMVGTVEVATFGQNIIELGKNAATSVISLCGGIGEIGVTGGILAIFSDKIGLKGNSQAALTSNGDSTAAASKANAEYTGLAQTAQHAPSSDTDYSYSLMQARCTKNSDSSTASESYINLTAKPDGTAPATVKASDITVLSSRETNPYIVVKNDADTIYTVPFGKTIALTTMDSHGQSSDGGIGFDGTNVSLGGANIVVNGETYSMPRFMTAIQPVVLYNGGAALTYDTAPGAGTTGTVTLSETAANFKELTLYLTDNTGRYAGTFTLAALPGATAIAVGQTCDAFGFEAAYVEHISTFIRRTRYALSTATTLVPSNGGYVLLYSGSGVTFSDDGVNYLKIYRVTGRR